MKQEHSSCTRTPQGPSADIVAITGTARASRKAPVSLGCLLAACFFVTAMPVRSLSAAELDGKPAKIDRRKPWTASRVKGSPEPPLPYRAKRVFPHLGFRQPTVLTSAPGTERLFVAESSGKIYSIPDDRDCRKADLFLDLKEVVAQLNERIRKAEGAKNASKQSATDGGDEKSDEVVYQAVYGLTFHPGFAKNRRCFVCYVVGYKNGKRGQHPHGTRVVELKVNDTDPPRAIVESEEHIISWLQGGHNGGCIKFGGDGKLYISSGDGGFAFPPDGRNSGQNVGNLLSAVLRIDVDRQTGDRAYAIPADNPLVGIPDARGEIWAYGMRNPWKMSFDRATGDLWVGDVGWELWELVYRVKPGGNYGWSLFEGRQPVHAERKRGPTPILPPTVEIPHTEGASITGGFVYRGKRLPELKGYYIFGDWETRRFWGVPVEEDKVGARKELVEPTIRIVGFAERNDGELLLLDYDDGSIHELVKNEVQATDVPFPRRLSETGLFASVAEHTPASGIVPFSIHAAQWSDHATAERWLGLPGKTSITLKNDSKRIAGSMFQRVMDFPKDAVLMKTLSLELVRSEPTTKRRVETQLLHFNGYDWRGYSYRWNAEQTDAELVEAAGATASFEITDADAPGGRRRQEWRFSSRMECIRCHNPWAEFSLAFNVAQLNRPDDVTGVNQLDRLRLMGVFRDPQPELNGDDSFVVAETPLPTEERPRLTDPFDESESLERRARAYLHVNCAHCHRFNGGGSARIYLPFDLPHSKTEAVGTRPTQGSFGIHEARIISPGDPLRSVLYFRMAKTGPGHMPHLGAKIIDDRGLKLTHDWIRQLPRDIELAEQIDELAGPEESVIRAREQRNAAYTRWTIAKRIASSEGRAVPTQADMDAAAKQAKAEADGRAATRKSRRKELIDQTLADPRAAIAMARALREGRFPTSIRTRIVTEAATHESLVVRDLFDPFLPAELRSKRLGDAIDPEKLLQLAGDAQRGRQLFLTAKTIQCRNCHRVGEEGKPLGPDLTHIGKKLDRAKLLESLLEPSKVVDPKFTSWLIETKKGKVYTGLLVRRTDKEVVIRDGRNVEHRFEEEEIEGMFPQRTSLMPERMARDLTAQQVADLLTWLQSLK